MLLLLAACEPEPVPTPPTPAVCEAPPPPAEATWIAGDNGGVFVLPDGRILSPAGTQIELGGFPADVVVVGDYALVTNAHRSERSLQVIRLSDGALVDEVLRRDAFPGSAVKGQRVWVAGGNGGAVDVYDVGSDGVLAQVTTLEVGGFIAGIAFDADGDLWASRFLQSELVELDPDTGELLRTVALDAGPYALTYVAETDELWASSFAENQMLIVDAAAGVQDDAPEIGGRPSELLLDPTGQTIWVTLSNDDVLLALDVASREEVGRVRLGEASFADEDGLQYPGTSPSALAYDDTSGRLYVTRAADNAVDVLDASTLDVIGSIPTGWYPTALALSDDTLVVTNGKGVGTGDNADGTFVSDAMVGTASIVPLDDAALGGWTEVVAANTAHPSEVYPFTCEGTFPIPRSRADKSVIEHVILIVRENKTYDSLLGDLAGADGDPSLLTFPADVTPNLHALAASYTNHDNFYDTSESSVQGHLALTGMFVNEYMERAWIEDYHGVSSLADDSATGAGTPGFGTVFTHLYRNGVEFTNYGELVGAFDEVDGQSMGAFVDLDYPGVFFNLEVLDSERAAYVADEIGAGHLAPFTYMLLPTDHTYGGSGGRPTPESMVADNDYATGLVVDALSRSEFWEKSVVFIVEDDPQGESDHVDAHRSILLTISPWAKREHNSVVHTSYPSIYRTIFAILGLPPLSRHDALATPLWDDFTSTMDTTAFHVIPKKWPEEFNEKSGGLARASACLDFSGPDRNPLMSDILYWHRTGAPRPGSALAAGETDCRVLNSAGLDEDDADAWDDSWRKFDVWRAQNPGKADHILRPPAPAWRNEEEEEE